MGPPVGSAGLRGSVGDETSLSESTVNGGMVGLDFKKNAIFSLKETTSGCPLGVFEFRSL